MNFLDRTRDGSSFNRKCGLAESPVRKSASTWPTTVASRPAFSGCATNQAPYAVPTSEGIAARTSASLHSIHSASQSAFQS